MEPDKTRNDELETAVKAGDIWTAKYILSCVYHDGFIDGLKSADGIVKRVMAEYGNEVKNEF